MSGKRKYFPNNWKEIEATPAEFFPEITWEEFYEWRVDAWELPSSVCCIIREQNKDTGKIKEHVYSRQASAVKKLESIVKDATAVVCNHDSILSVFIRDPNTPEKTND